MGRLFLVSLDAEKYSCKYCHAHLALFDDLISKGEAESWVDLPDAKAFQCRHGKAYLFDKVVNVTVGEKEDRMMMTGLHTVVDIFCVGCGSLVGWKYEAAYDESQRYKEGKFILERFQILGPDGSVYQSRAPQLVGIETDADDM